MSLPVVKNEVVNLTRRVEKLEASVESLLSGYRWVMGASAGAGAILALLLPKIAKALGIA